VIVRDILNGSLEETGTGNDAKGDESSRDVHFAIRQAAREMDVSKAHAQQKCGGISILLLANAGTASLAKRKKRLLQFVVGQAVNEPPFGDELVGVGEEVGVPVVDHRSHADWGASGDNPLGLAVLALVDQVLFAGNSSGSVRDTGHHAQGLVDDGPQVWLLLELHPLEVSRVNIVQIFHQASVEFRLSKEPVCDDSKNGLILSV
jgi:hypothetical protein